MNFRRNPNPKRRHSSGLSLIEVMVAIVVMSFTVIFFLQIQKIRNSTIQEKRSLTTASRLIEDTVEGMRALIAVDPDTNFPPSDTTIINNDVQLDIVVGDAFDPSGALIDGARQVSMTASWMSPGGTIRTIDVHTFVARDY